MLQTTSANEQHSGTTATAPHNFLQPRRKVTFSIRPQTESAVAL